MNWEWDNTLEEILPDTARIDAFLKQLLPGQPVHIVDMMQEILQGNWVMEPMMFWKYIHTYILGYTTEWKKLFISILVLFILCSVITSFLGAFQNTGAAQTAEFLFLLCQLVVLITALYRNADYGAYAGISQACDSILYDLHCGSRFWLIRFRIL